jgi:hypothetical protein
MLQTASDGGAFRHFWLLAVVSVEDEIPSVDQGPLPTVADAPIDEEVALIEHTGVKRLIFRAEVSALVTAKAVLRFSAGQIGISEDVAATNMPRAATDDENYAALHRRDSRALSKDL